MSYKITSTISYKNCAPIFAVYDTIADYDKASEFYNKALVITLTAHGPGSGVSNICITVSNISMHCVQYQCKSLCFCVNVNAANVNLCAFVSM